MPSTLICFATLRVASSLLGQVFSIPANIQGGVKHQVDFFLLVGFLCYLHRHCSARAMQLVTSGARTSSALGLEIDKVASDHGRQAGSAARTEERGSPENLFVGLPSSQDSEDLLGYEDRQLNPDVRTNGCPPMEGGPGKKGVYTIAACVKQRNVWAALQLFDQMLEKGAAPDASTCSRSTFQRYFKIVAENLDDERIQKDGLRLLALVQDCGIAPSSIVQNRLLEAWNGKPPESVSKYFLQMRSVGLILSRWAYCHLVLANERSDPGLALKIYDEMEDLGIHTDRATYNAVLSACSQLGMLDEARRLFMQMADRELVPSLKSYGIMIKVYTFSFRCEEAIALLERMREQCLEPDRYAYHHAITSCIRLRRLQYAVQLYRDMCLANVACCASTYDLLSRQCKNFDQKAPAVHLRRTRRA